MRHWRPIPVAPIGAGTLSSRGLHGIPALRAARIDPMAALRTE